MVIVVERELIVTTSIGGSSSIVILYGINLFGPNLLNGDALSENKVQNFSQYC